MIAVQAFAGTEFDPPRLSITPSGTVELGSLGPREPGTVAYTLRNTSAAPITLRVLDLAPGVRVEGPALLGPIPPQGSAALTLSVDPEGWVGAQSRNVRLGTDDPRQGAYFLPTHMTVRPELTVDGERRDFGDLLVPGSRQEVFTFQREGGEPVAIRVLEAVPAYLECEIQAGRHQTQLLVTLRGDRVAPGVRLGLERLTVETSVPMQPRFDLYLTWRIHHAVEALPSRVVFMGPAERELRLTLKSQAGDAFRIDQARVEGDGFQVDPPAPTPAADQVLGVRRSGDGQARAMLVLVFAGGIGELRVPLVYVP